MLAALSSQITANIAEANGAWTVRAPPARKPRPATISKPAELVLRLLSQSSPEAASALSTIELLGRLEAARTPPILEPDVLQAVD
mmetsp:Transcript_84499/g.149565  ORF Transcript_84499/g.149565 Transcript_84499/m.149565 type:complete len:85 (-) Transcript_84499:283-537(-)